MFICTKLFLNGLQIRRNFRLYSNRAEKSLLSAYKDRVAANSLEYIDDQYNVLRYLHRLSNYLEKNPRTVTDVPDDAEDVSNEENAGALPNTEPSARIAGEEKSTVESASPIIPLVKGIYIHGGVGVGKTMLMDMFFANCVLDEGLKRRVHLHKFLLEIHARIHNFKQNLLKTQGRDVHIDLDPKKDAISNVALAVAKETRLLAFDEFEVTDIADALILSKFFRVLWERGTVVVATSNRPPVDLYKHGLNREYFLPFIDLLHRHNIVCEVRGQDFRSKVIPCASRSSLFRDKQDLWKAFVASGQAHPELVLQKDMEVQIPGSNTRVLRIPAAFVPRIKPVSGISTTPPPNAPVAAWMSFSELCELGEHGASDFNALVERFPTVYLHSVPQLSVLQHDVARRFVILVDILYDAHARLVWSSMHEPDVMFRYYEAEESEEAAKDSNQWVTPSFELPADKPESEMESVADADSTISAENISLAKATKRKGHKSLRSAEQLTRTWHLRETPGGREGRELLRPLRSGVSDSCVHSAAHLSLTSTALGLGSEQGSTDTLMVLEGEVSSVKELLFAFRRAASRLTEMRGTSYLEEWERRRRERNGKGSV